MNIKRSEVSLAPVQGRPWYVLGGLLAAVLSLPLAALWHPARLAPAAVSTAAPPTTPVLTAASAADTAAVQARVRQLPLYFIENQGQSDPQVGYYLHGGETSAYFTAQGLTLALQAPAPEAEPGARQADRLQRLGRPEPATPPSVPQRWAVKVQFVGAEPVKPQGRAKTAAVVSYFTGPQSDWKAGLATYQEVVYPGVWPGIDVVYSGDGGRLKTTFHVQPGADPGRIALAYQGASAVRLTEAGRLAVQTPVGGFEEERPLVYQEIEGRRVAVQARYTLAQAGEGEWRSGFAVGDYDPGRPLIIDPVMLAYCGYIGGSGDDHGYGIAVDGAGQAYVVGQTGSNQASFPVRGGPDLTLNGITDTDAFVAKVSADGTQLVYAGYIGGSLSDGGRGIAVDGAGQAYVVGSTYSTEASFPVRGGPDLTFNGIRDAFVAKVSADGTQLVYAGYIGGSGDDGGYGIAVDGAGRAYVVGQTDSKQPSFPVRGGPDLTHNGGTIDAFVAKVSADGTQLVYAGYIGGSSPDYGCGIAVNGGRAYVVGYTGSTQNSFPVRSGPDLTFNDFEDTFVANLADTDLALSKSSAPNPVLLGRPLTYTLTVRNNGPLAVPDGVLTDTLPAGVTFKSASSGCSYDGVRTVTCTLGALPAGTSAGATLTVIPTALGVLTNTARVSSQTVIDDNLADNQATTTTTTVAVAADLALTKADSPDPVQWGQALTYSLTVTNQGPNTATTVVVTDTLPATMTFISASSGCSHATGVVTCTLGDLVNGATRQVQIQARPHSIGTPQNSATVSSSTAADSNLVNNEAQQTTTVQPFAGQVFTDLPPQHWAYAAIQTLAQQGLISGCGNGQFCPDDLVTRAQVAVFLERLLHGSGYTPPPASGTPFSDVPAEHWAADWIYQVTGDGLIQGCGSERYCPDRVVTRAELAIYLGRLVHGAGFTPPPASGTHFSDVPAASFAAAWIEQLADDGITGGCGNDRYCPQAAVTRAELAMLLDRIPQVTLPAALAPPALPAQNRLAGPATGNPTATAGQ